MEEMKVNYNFTENNILYFFTDIEGSNPFFFENDENYININNDIKKKNINNSIIIKNELNTYFTFTPLHI
jgi:hypothetical protein